MQMNEILFYGTIIGEHEVLVAPLKLSAAFRIEECTKKIYLAISKFKI